MSLGKDLAYIRKKQNLSLEDIQNEIKIPLQTLKSIEDGSIFTDSGETKTYIRSFVRSYAKVLGLADDDVVQALNEMEAGTYSGSLLADTKKPDEVYQDIEKIDTSKDAEPVKEDSETGSKVTADSEHEPKPKPKQPSESTPAYTPPKPKPVPATDVNSVNWADMGKKFTSVRKHSNLWVIISFFIVLVIAILATIFYWDSLSSVFSEDPQPEPQTEVIDPSAPPSETQIPEAENTIPTQIPTTSETGEPEQPANQAIQSLDDTLTVTVYAAFDKLEPVRVTSDFNWKTNPFWMEQGNAFNFDFRDSLLIDGQYSRMLLLFNGHIIENPRQSYFDETFNAVLITRSILDQPRFLEAAPAEFPLEIGAPDSTEYVIRY
ncbi:helix-turn-helix domain-containing protein [Gracilimonas amylolytica]|uniref:helix-turn-helix domain-containing protein n=1 Tax=Gracilimonas amylolytica TaxID=1749045 RepID=UPI0012FFD433|nr:helix-turn-helix transcriptional regulator [Gracilimonas amylolytica]